MSLRQCIKNKCNLTAQESILFGYLKEILQCSNIGNGMYMADVGYFSCPESFTFASASNNVWIFLWKIICMPFSVSEVCVYWRPRGWLISITAGQGLIMWPSPNKKIFCDCFRGEYVTLFRPMGVSLGFLPEQRREKYAFFLLCLFKLFKC